MEGAIVSACRVNYDLSYNEEGVCHLRQMEENIQLLWVKRKLGSDTYLVADLLNNYVDSNGYITKLVAGAYQKIDREDDAIDTLNTEMFELNGEKELFLEFSLHWTPGECCLESFQSYRTKN